MDKRMVVAVAACTAAGLLWSLSLSGGAPVAEALEAPGALAADGGAARKGKAKVDGKDRAAAAKGAKAKAGAGKKAAKRRAAAKSSEKGKKAAGKAAAATKPDAKKAAAAKKSDAKKAAVKKPDAKKAGGKKAPAPAKQAHMYVAEHELYTARFIDQGATLLSFELRNYKNVQQTRQLDLVARDLPWAEVPIKNPGHRALALHLIEDKADHKAQYAIHECKLFLDPKRKCPQGKKGQTGLCAQLLVCKWLDPGRIEIVKKVHFRPNSYQLDVEVELRNLSKDYLTSTIGLQMTSFQGAVQGGGCFQPPPDVATSSCLIGKSLEHESIEDIVKKHNGRWPMDGQLKWGGVDMRYFLAAMIPLDGRDADGLGAFTSSRCELLALGGGHAVGARVIPRRQLRMQRAGGATDKAVARFELYMGPKVHNVLEAVTVKQAGKDTKVGLEESVNFWILGFICKPMLWLLNLFHSWVGNFGIAIILLTFVVKVITFWPSQKSYRSMEGMKKLKKPMEEIRAKFKGDKARMNQEMMNLYKRHKINPLGGCLPLLIQMPIWIALYRTIYASVEIYQQPFFGWIQDLSAKDPYYVLPILLGVVMFIQQRMAPSQGDSMQMKLMMYGMPLLFTGMMLFFPSGLVLYIFVNTVLSIGQQWMIKKGMEKKPA